LPLEPNKRLLGVCRLGSLDIAIDLECVVNVGTKDSKDEAERCEEDELSVPPASELSLHDLFARSLRQGRRNGLFVFLLNHFVD